MASNSITWYPLRFVISNHNGCQTCHVTYRHAFLPQFVYLTRDWYYFWRSIPIFILYIPLFSRGKITKHDKSISVLKTHAYFVVVHKIWKTVYCFKKLKESQQDKKAVLKLIYSRVQKSTSNWICMV